MNLLYIEDSAEAREYVTRGLNERGWQVTCAADGTEGLDLALREPYDVCILDLGLPGLDGTEVLRRVRAAEVEMAILVLTARTDVSDRVLSLLAGADDYLMKPFAFEELVARIVALTRRLPPGEAGVRRHRPRPHPGPGPPPGLPPRGGGGAHPARVRDPRAPDEERRHGALPRHDHRAHLGHRPRPRESYSNAINVHINHLRKKIDRGHEMKLIHTVTGVGYILEARDA